MQESLSHFLKLRCTACGKEFEAEMKPRTCECGKVLFALYDLERAKETLTKESMPARSFDLWRMHEIMPVKDPRYRITLGEGWTPLIDLPRLGKLLDYDALLLKDEGQNPTGTFKSRGLCAAIAKANELGITEFVIPTAGKCVEIVP